MKKLRIGIVGNIFTMESGLILGLERAYVNDDYIRAVERVGGAPIVLAVVKHEECIRAQIECCSGLILTGGHDIHPKYYRQEARPYLGDVNSRVDEYQLNLIRIALELEKPILGICRGHQLLNVACGGTLAQDLSDLPGKCLKHLQSSRRYEVSHQVKTVAGSTVEELLGNEFWVNSYHHQAIQEVGKGLTVAATASDGVIEAVQMIGGQFVLGVQWHPK